MKSRIFKKSLLYICVFLPGFPIAVLADATDGGDDDEIEASIEMDLVTIGNAQSQAGNAAVGASGLLLEAEYEGESIAFSLGLERWQYDWTNPENLPFISGTTTAPWSTFNTLQFGVAYETEGFDERWEFSYYAEAESSFEKEMSASYEYELGVDVNYELSESWHVSFVPNFEYLDAEGGEFGMDIEIEWNHDKKDGWSGEYELSTEFPETSMSYHFTPAFSTTLFLSESGTSTIRLSDSSPVIGMAGGYLEDEIQTIGARLSYEAANESYLSFSIQQNMQRQLTFIDARGVESAYSLGDSLGVSIVFSYSF